MSKKSARHKKPSRPAPEPIDPQLRALLLYMDNASPDSGGTTVDEVVSAARRILHQPGAFDEYIGTPSVHEAVIKWLRWGDEDGYGKSHNAIVAAIRRASNKEFIAREEYVLDVVNISIGRAALIGAAIMYSLLKGGGRC